MKRILPYMKRYRFYAILCPILMILEVFADIIIPYLMAKIVDIGIKNSDFDYVIKTGIIMVIVALVGMLIGMLSAYFGAKAGFGFAAEIRQETFQKIQGFSFSNLDDFRVSSLITRLTNDCNTLGQVAMMSLRMAVRFPFMLIFALIMAFRINLSLALILVLGMFITVILAILLMAKARPLFTIIQSKVDRLNGVIKENLAAIGVVKSFNRQDYEEERFKERNDDLKDVALKAISIMVIAMPVLNVIIYSIIIAVLSFGSQQVISGVIGTGELISFITYITQIMMALIMISVFSMQFMRGMASANRIIEVWDANSEITEIKEPIKSVKDGSIIFENVSFSYGSKKEILKDINLQINSGERVGIIGSTGSAKSTLVQLIPRLYDVNIGSVEVAGINVKNYDLKVLRDQVAFVLQKNSLFSGTIRSNMKWGNENASDEEIIKSLKQAQAWEFVSKYNEKLDYKVEQGGDNFSGGQKQRLTIARALIKNPKILILDDSTSAVDMTTDAKIQKAFNEELGQLTTIIIAQRISSIEKMDKIVVMHEGQIESIGKHEDLLLKSPIYKEIYESQKKGVISE